MKTGRLVSLAVLALAAPLAAAPLPKIPTAARQDVLLRTQRGVAVPGRMTTQSPSAPRAAFTVELPQVARLQGLGAFYRTAVDIANNTSNAGVTARLQFSYANSACTNGFCRTQPFIIALANFDSFHTDDMVDFLDSQGLLVAGAVDNAVGTLLITFDNLPSASGWEGTATARLYTRVDEANPSLGTIGYAFPSSLFFDSAYRSLTAVVRDTSTAALSGGTQGSQRTNIGIRNTDIHAPAGSNRPVSVRVTFIDVTEGSPTNGQQVGNALTAINLLPGEVRIIGNVFSSAAIPANVSQCIAFVDVTDPLPAPPPAAQPTPTVEAFVVTIDNVTQDGSYFEMKCADIPFTCGQ